LPGFSPNSQRQQGQDLNSCSNRTSKKIFPSAKTIRVSNNKHFK